MTIRFPNLNAEQARKGLTNQKVADKLGLSRTSYEIKKKSGRFVVAEVKTLCSLFGCDFPYLFDSESDGSNAG